MMDALEAIQKRYSCRSFSKEQISEEQTQALIAAAKAAPAAMGDYSGISLTVIQDEDARTLIERETAHSMPMMGEHPAYEAPTLLLISVKENADFPMIPYCNASCMAENIMIAAAAMGLASVYIMAVPTVMRQKPELLHELGIDSAFLPVVMIAIGCAGNRIGERKAKNIVVKLI
ncbi:nitroreductase family protein [Dysosmobacter sp.]